MVRGGFYMVNQKVSNQMSLTVKDMVATGIFAVLVWVTILLG